MQIITEKKILRKKSVPTTVEECQKKGIFKQLEDTLDSVGKNGAGLTAIQIGIPWRVAIVGAPEKRVRLINPSIVKHGPEGIYPQEGCLSLPGVSVDTRRYQSVRIKYLNEKGDECEAWFKDLSAVIVQHEIDHMDGILITDRESAKKRKIGRNERCPCGSGKKYKKCCGK